ncbi:hypothetical protein O6H91_15G048900 [Diphasiastrum complanatum]|uniref:Uncharacterized protein n=1 Tax=Diphasiastrum complanatum TaxID=34168 RepID=A0ACC2BI34_DIPCM|nr:hypothetical protein O6H91_Y044600 [Diphasiastrum complanatum]KAJ7529414.1 hypothetical protein O6H91_15G048900 [Diphasiastrum complanatum]
METLEYKSFSRIFRLSLSKYYTGGQGFGGITCYIHPKFLSLVKFIKACQWNKFIWSEMHYKELVLTYKVKIMKNPMTSFGIWRDIWGFQARIADGQSQGSSDFGDPVWL